MKLAVIVQARYGSSRLPGKALAPIGAETALARCLARCGEIPGVDAVVCATPDGVNDDEVAVEALRAGAFVVRGSERDVLSRYALAARAVKADMVMRVTSDCPLIDPVVCGQVRDALALTGADYACNTAPRRWPHGLDCEAFPAERLYEAARLAEDPFEREHVTVWLRENRDFIRTFVKGPGGGVERLRWTLDYDEDLAFFRALFLAMGERAASASWTEIADFCAAHSEIVRLNAHLVDPIALGLEPAAPSQAQA